MDKVKVIEDFVSTQDCAEAIAYYDDQVAQGEFVENFDGRLLKSKIYFGFPVSLIIKYLPKLNELYNTTFYVRDILLSIYPNGASLKPHIDYTESYLKNSLGVVFYFNDNFEGGQIYFSNFEFKHKLKKGSVIIFPCNDKEYEHGVRLVTSGKRYTMPVEITTNEKLSIL